jgi:hypothetical protein
MGRVTSAAPHLSAEEIARHLKETVGTREDRRWLIIVPLGEWAKTLAFR